MVNPGGNNLEKEVTTILLKESSPGHRPSFFRAIYLQPTEFRSMPMEEPGLDLDLHFQAQYMRRRHRRVTWVIH